jgi:hypothetical protein
VEAAGLCVRVGGDAELDPSSEAGWSQRGNVWTRRWSVLDEVEGAVELAIQVGETLRDVIFGEKSCVWRGYW